MSAAALYVAGGGCNSSSSQPSVGTGDAGGACTDCQAGQLCCNEACVEQDFQNCGACGTVCPAGAQCCVTSGVTGCTTLDDPLNCGGCGNACDPGVACCNGKCANDDVNCGTCGNACTGNKTCCASGGVTACCTGDAGAVTDPCGGTCTASQRCCDVAGSHDCIDPDTDNLNCGGCGSPCEANTVCAGGLCVPVDAGSSPEAGQDGSVEAGSDAASDAGSDAGD